MAGAGPGDLVKTAAAVPSERPDAKGPRAEREPYRVVVAGEPAQSAAIRGGDHAALRREVVIRPGGVGAMFAVRAAYRRGALETRRSTADSTLLGG